MCTKHLGGSHVFEDQLEYVSCSHTGEQALLNNVARAAGSHWFAATLAFAMKRGFREIRMVPMSGGGPNAQTAFLREFFHKGDNLEKVEPLGTVSHQVAPATAPAHPFVYSGQDPRAFTAPPEPQFTPGFAPGTLHMLNFRSLPPGFPCFTRPPIMGLEMQDFRLSLMPTWEGAVLPIKHTSRPLASCRNPWEVAAWA